MPEPVKFGLEYKYNFGTDTFSNPTMTDRCADKNDKDNTLIDCNNMRKLIDVYRLLIDDNKYNKKTTEFDISPKLNEFKQKIFNEYLPFLDQSNGQKYKSVFDISGNIINKELYTEMAKSPELLNYVRETNSPVMTYSIERRKYSISCVHKDKYSNIIKVVIGKKLLGRRTLLTQIMYIGETGKPEKKYVELDKFCVIQDPSVTCHN
jgi:hypothetical protein